ncbi:hypothetical protein [Streptomyces sp. NPDC000229]|uniref:hypothetical protein n=1 Tax=Streptomyces sp. NPDC000229 TaxID=3154247 RepID=UPI003324247B
MLSTGANANINVGVSEHPLLQPLRELRAELTAVERTGHTREQPGHAGLEAELAAAQQEIERSGTLEDTRRQVLRNRLEIFALASAGSASLTTLAQTVVTLLN